MMKVLYVTYIRSEYELMKKVLARINKEFKLVLVVAGAHLDKTHGNTINEVKKSFKINYVVKGKEGSFLNGVARIIKKEKPDLTLVSGDRYETVLTALVSVSNRIPVAHLSGGEVSGSVDDSYRHAITKLAHVHLPSTSKSAERILAMGEEPWRVHVVGHPYNCTVASKEELDKHIGFKVDRKTIILLQHSVVSEQEEAREQIWKTIKAIPFCDENCKENKIVWIYPNNDPGCKAIIKVMKAFEEEQPDNVKFFKNLPGPIFASLMKYAGVMVGNSSAGIAEAPFYKLPVVNIGTRQEGRERGDNVISVAYDTGEIGAAICFALDPRMRKKMKNNPYYSKGVEAKICKALKEAQLVFQKRLVI
jgi:GDP/UDP-N,N'-diacetylbacillosamine 2-epimerase (hydrolysing)